MPALIPRSPTRWSIPISAWSPGMRRRSISPGRRRTAAPWCGSRLPGRRNPGGNTQPGSELQPVSGFAVMIAAGLDGIKEKISRASAQKEYLPDVRGGAGSGRDQKPPSRPPRSLTQNGKRPAHPGGFRRTHLSTLHAKTIEWDLLPYPCSHDWEIQRYLGVFCQKIHPATLNKSPFEGAFFLLTPASGTLAPVLIRGINP